jgi:predicted outer membrane repeat protein
MGRKMAMMATAGAAAMLAGGVMPAAAATVTKVPCSTPALDSAVSGAASGTTLSLARGCTYVLTSALPTVVQDLTINGNGATLHRSTAVGTAAFTILTINAGTVTLNRLSFTNGNGAITVNNLATLIVTGGVFSGNTAVNGGAINNTAATVVQVNDASFINNTATGDGGAMYVFTALGDQITDCRFLGNTAAGSGGAYWEWSNGTAISHSTFTGNKATTGGALYLDDQGSLITATVLSGNGATGDGGGIFDSPGGTPVPITGSTITGNHAGGTGGGLDEESYGEPEPVTNTIIAGNSATAGGGINDGDGVLINYTGDTISGNHASGDGGGINSQNAGALFTGIILFHRHADGIDNRTSSAQESASMSFADSTISGNSADGRGGGVYNQGSLDASRTQIIGNRAVGGGGGIYDDGTEATVTLTDSRPAGNVPDNCEPLGSITGCTG